ncbi:sensor histidine kinase [Kitasatospora kifunensis]|uniref:histidine kinase n=1 Tax=Kitasatospora kifunensis TaxID=58351 RepID=A0A7W7VT41_KITKI|nr:HAMP domain-containing sensor histidine kinase [Kitasatospora kifunensis]MBB4921284.1 two-component system sensor histidine kinase MprB [Kitasatospora kifunensis]
MADQVAHVEISHGQVADGTQPSGGGSAQGIGGRLARVSLRGRLVLLTVVAISLAVVVCSTASWFLARDRMINQVDQTLKQSVGPISKTAVRHLASLCGGTEPYDTGLAIPTVVFATGRSCPPDGGDRVVVTPGDVAIAAGSNTDSHAASRIRTGRTRSGKSVRVYVIGMPANQPRGSTAPMAVLVSQPLAPVQQALRELALFLAALAAVVITGTALGARWIARTALRPVKQLTEAVEQIARTQEPGTTITVFGRDEIARLSESFNAMSTALASSRDRQSRLIADAGHELRTPLTSLRTNVDLLVRSDQTGRALPEQTRGRMLATMKAQLVELSTLINDLLELSRPTRAVGTKSLEVVALHEVAARALDRARLRGPGLAFTVDLHPWYVRADAHTMERAVINLLDNAVKFSPPGGAIDVRLRSGTLTVRDHGPGIPAEDLPHVFDRFWRSPSARQLPGSGLGLAIVAQAIREAGGEVSLGAAEAEPAGASAGAIEAGGAVATIQLPGTPTAPPPPASAPGN